MGQRDDDQPHWPTVQIAASSQEQACAVACYAIQHLLFAKGQIDQPIAVLRKRRQQQLHQHRQAALSGSDDECASVGRSSSGRPKAKSFATRRDERRLEEMLHNVDRLRGQMIDALKTLASSSSPCSSSSSSAGQDTVTLMLRMGQSPSTLAKQQYLIQLRGIFRLPCTAQQADEQRPQPVRQVFGGKSAIPSSSMSRLPALERKLVRFLLSASMEESPLAHALAAPVAPTRSQVFLSAKTSFAAQGWIPRRSLSVNEDACAPARPDADEMDVAQACDDRAKRRSVDSTEQEEQNEATADDVDELAQALSPLKRRVMSPTRLSEPQGTPSRLPGPSNRKPGPMLFWEPGAIGHRMSETSKTPDETVDKSAFAPLESLSQGNNGNSMDAKRMARLQARSGHMPVAQQAGTGTGQGISTMRIAKRKLGTTRRHTLTAGFVIDYGAQEDEWPKRERQGEGREERSPEPKVWFASDIVIRACAT